MESVTHLSQRYTSFCWKANIFSLLNAAVGMALESQAGERWLYFLLLRNHFFASVLRNQTGVVC